MIAGKSRMRCEEMSAGREWQGEATEGLGRPRLVQGGSTLVR